MMKVVIIMDILVLRFYKYIKNIGKISVKQKLIKIYRNVWKNSKKNYQTSKNTYF